MIYRTQAALDEALEYWQGALRLRDWEVEAEVVGRDRMGGEDCIGTIDIDERAKKARIVLVRQDDYPDSPWPQDHEKTLVHELLHIHTQPITPIEYDRLAHIAEEQAIVSIASALVRLKRGFE